MGIATHERELYRRKGFNPVSKFICFFICFSILPQSKLGSLHHSFRLQFFPLYHFDLGYWWMHKVHA
ncbi:hypothetical protein K1719_028589 [Acacia pycnantha]|nr:hypothetical protein K1719_028589 [Acacia pycnantha]